MESRPSKLNENCINILKKFYENETTCSELLDDKKGTQFLIAELEKAGETVPEGFHYHVIEKGESLPQEPEMEGKQRDIYIFHGEKAFEHRNIQPDTNNNHDKMIMDNHSLGFSFKCVFCGTCIIFEKKKKS